MIKFNALYEEKGDKIIISKICSVNKKEHTLEIDKADYIKWKALNMYVQDAFPDHSAQDREFIKTGITPAEWDQMFPEEEDDSHYDDPDLPF